MIEIPFFFDIKNLVNDLKIMSWEAADILLHYSQEIKKFKQKNKIIQFKGKNDPVTLADLRVNELIIKRIREKYSEEDCNILSEESEKIDSKSLLSNSEWLWILDPLDGTKDFIQGTGNYAMHLALNYRNKPFLGVVLLPSENELWIAYKGRVWCERKDGSYLQPININKKKSLENMKIVTSKNHRNQILENIISKVNFKERIIMGSIGCKIASIVRGESDIYMSLSLPDSSAPKDWDFAAPEIILKAAGGAITNLDNQDLSYNQANFEQRGIIIASNNRQNHKSTCLEIKEIIKKHDLYPLKS